jgi:3-methyl-2-oxobutanoate hydroxymethyltransferase
MKKITIKKILKKKGKKPIVCLTAYSEAIAEILDKYCDIILVGDSVGMVLYGMKTTKDVKLETMINHGRAVKNCTKKSFVVFDMPYNTYPNKFVAYKNAKKVIKNTKCDAIKLEGGKKIVNIIHHLTKKGIPVMGHVGLLPQYSSNFKLKGRSFLEKKKILEDSIALSKSGVFAIVIECVVENLAKEITKKISVPTIGIGASKHCDGQILVTDDMIGLSNFHPKFVKKYSNVKKIIEKSVKKYSHEVKNKKFPRQDNIYKF